MLLLPSSLFFLFFFVPLFASQEDIQEGIRLHKEWVRARALFQWYQKDIYERDNVKYIWFQKEPLEKVSSENKNVSIIKRNADEFKYKYKTTQHIVVAEYPSTLCGKYIQRNIPFLRNFSCLLSLDLTKCHLQKIDLNELVLLQEVNLYQNDLKNCDGIAKLTRLISINIDKNALTCVKGLKNLSQLKFFFARDNYGIDDIPPFLPNLITCSLSGNSIEKHFRYEISIGCALVEKDGLSLLFSLLGDIQNPTPKQQELELQLLKLMHQKNTYEVHSLLSNYTVSSQKMPAEFIPLYIQALTKPKEHNLNALLKKFPPFPECDYRVMSFAEKDKLFQRLKRHIDACVREHYGSAVHDRYQELTKSLPDLFEAIFLQSMHYYTNVFLCNL